MEAHLSFLRQSTQDFIDQDPTVVVLKTVSGMVRGPGGGMVPAPGTPRAPQRVKLISSSESGVSSGEGGTDRVFEYVIVAEHDAVIEINDWWEDSRKNKFIVYAIEPDNGYEVKARARSHGADPSDG